MRVVCVSVESVRVCSGASRFFYGASTPKGKHQPVNFPNFCRKLHENERIWIERKGARPWHPTVCVIAKYTYYVCDEMILILQSAIVEGILFSY